MAIENLRLGTRGSALALWQAHYVQRVLELKGVAVEIVEIKTKGDRILDVPLAQIGDKGLFTRELDQALLDGSIHLAVHSLKDLPTRLPAGIVLAAVTAREEPFDVFVAHPSFSGTLDDLPEEATIATSSLRRQAQLLAWRSDLHIESVRGNVDTRLKKLDAGSWHGMILAAAGLIRLGLGHRIRERISLDRMVPAVSQGALGIVCSEADPLTQDRLYSLLEDPETRFCTGAERAFLRRMEGGCQVPVGAYAVIQNQQIVLVGCVARTDGSLRIRGTREGKPEEAEQIGTSLAEQLLSKGADVILSEIRGY